MAPGKSTIEGVNSTARHAHCTMKPERETGYAQPAESFHDWIDAWTVMLLLPAAQFAQDPSVSMKNIADLLFFLEHRLEES